MLQNKKLKTVFIVLTFLSFYLFTFSTALAAVSLTSGDLNYPLPGVSFSQAQPGDWIGQYVAGIYKYGIGVAVFLAVIMIMAGGFMWLVSAGRPGQIQVAQDFIKSALLGLVLALFSYLLLYTVNPRLISLDPINPQIINATPDRDDVDWPNCLCTITTYQGETKELSCGPVTTRAKCTEGNGASLATGQYCSIVSVCPKDSAFNCFCKIVPNGLYEAVEQCVSVPGHNPEQECGDIPLGTSNLGCEYREGTCPQ